MAEKLKVTLVKSPIGAIPKQKATVEALGLKKVNKTVELPDNDAVRGMVWPTRIRGLSIPVTSERPRKEGAISASAAPKQTWRRSSRCIP